MTAARTAAICLLLAGVALAGPTLRIGTKLTIHDFGESYMAWEDTIGVILREMYNKSSIGPAVEASYGPVLGVLTGRLDLAQMDFFTSGGAAFRLFPMLGLDVMAEPPTQWRVKPYAWVGVRATGYMQSALVRDLYHDSETHWRGGLGVKYKLTNRIDLFAETQCYSRDTYWEGVMIFPDRTYQPDFMMFEVIGLVNAEIGVRFALGK